MEMKSSPEKHAEITTLCGLLRQLSIGATMLYSDATHAIMRDVRGAARFSLMRAREIVETEDGSRFGTVAKIGVKRLETVDIPAIGTQIRRKVRRAARIGYRRLTGIKANDVTPEIQRQIDTERAVLGAVSLVTDEKSMRKVGEAVSKAGTEIPVGKTLDLFR